MGIKKELFVSMIFLLCINIFTAFSQEIDTLKSRLADVTGKEKIEILNELAGAYWELPPNERIVFAEQAVDLSEKFHNQRSKAEAFNHLGVAYNNMGDSQKSMDYFLMALKIMEQINDHSGIANSYVNLGQANFYLDNFDKALEYFQKALMVRNELGDKYDVSQSLILIGNVKGKTAKYDEALDFYFKALAIKKEIDDKNGVSQIYSNLGNIYFKTGPQKKALEYRVKSLQSARELDNKWEIALAAFNIAEYYLHNRQPDKAYPYIIESQDLSKNLDNKGLIRDNLHFFSLYHELKENYQKALKYQRDYSELTKNMFSEELGEKITEMQIKYETEKKERENQAYKFQLEKARSERMRLFLGLLIALLIVFIIYYRYRIKKKSALLLEDLVVERTHELKKKISELEQAEKTLQESEKKYRQLFDNSVMGVGISTHEGKLLVMNDAMLKMTGYTQKEFSKVNLQETYEDPQDRQKFLHIIQKEGEVENFEVRLKNKQGKVYWANLSSRTIKFDGKDAFLTTIMDITQQKRAEAELQKHRKHLEELVKERTEELENINKELQEKNKELERLNKLFIGREFRIKELRDMVKELEGKAGEKR